MPLSADEKQVYVAIWAKVVDTQMHFNEMSVRARQFGLAFVAAALGLGVVLVSRGQEAALYVPRYTPLIGGLKFHAIVFIPLASAVALYAVKLLDLRVYHRMLRGAVAFGEDFEQTYMKEIFDLRKGMTQAISHFSRYGDASVSLADGKYAYCGVRRVTAEKKIARFYTFSIVALLALTVLLFFVTSEVATYGTRPPTDKHSAQPATSTPVQQSTQSAPKPADNGK